MIINEQSACDSYLGTDPICDVCLKPIREGDKVKQTFTGVVRNDDGELGIAPGNYSLVHVVCNDRMLRIVR